jgi:hypothetical protein
MLPIGDSRIPPAASDRPYRSRDALNSALQEAALARSIGPHAGAALPGHQIDQRSRPGSQEIEL